MARRLTEQYSALSERKPHPLIEKTMQSIRDKMQRMGMGIVSYEITDEPLLDPAIAALPEADQRQIDAVAQGTFDSPAALRRAAEDLIERFPNIAVLWNQCYRAAAELEEFTRAEEIAAEMMARFPRYVFGFCNYVMALLHSGTDRIEEARALVETGPRGPLFLLAAFDPSRTLFHVSEVRAYAMMAGRYLVATGRLDAARVQLEMLKDAAPDEPQTKAFAELLETKTALEDVVNALRQISNPKQPRAKTKARKAASPSKRRSR